MTPGIFDLHINENFGHALIPFCSYKSDLSSVGHFIDNLSMPICDAFKPIAINGQLCYSMSFDPGKIGRGKDQGVGLILDPTAGQVISGTSQGKAKDSKQNKILNLGGTIGNPEAATLFLDTLAPFKDSRAGAYGLVAVKRMMGTEKFLGLPDSVKECGLEKYHDCNRRNFINDAMRECGCLPRSLKYSVNLLVI